MSMLAGGMLPLSATLATNSCFEAFQHDSKLKALLHGHSYTAHAIGCGTANTALDMYTDPACNPNLKNHLSSNQTEVTQLRELWDTSLVDKLSRHERVQKLVVLGMLAIHPSCSMVSETVSFAGRISAVVVAIHHAMHLGSKLWSAPCELRLDRSSCNLPSG